MGPLLNCTFLNRDIFRCHDLQYTMIKQKLGCSRKMIWTHEIPLKIGFAEYVYIT
jgi:hypothetical protein